MLMAEMDPKLSASGPSSADMETEIAQLRADLAKVTAQLATVGEHSFGAARRAAIDGAESLRAQGEAAMDSLRGSARDLEGQVVGAVREKPVTALAIAAGVGFLFAMIASR